MKKWKISYRYANEKTGGDDIDRGVQVEGNCKKVK